jgi:hypothetical protein
MLQKFDFNEDDEERATKMRDLMGPSQIDQQIRQATGWLWMVLPKDKRYVDEIEGQVRRLDDRALRDLRQDFANFFKKMDK